MFDANYKQLVDLDFLLIEQITDQSSNSTITISREDITSAVKEMNRGYIRHISRTHTIWETTSSRIHIGNL